jgi:tetratricopeptide (TPR) repeat protein/predicted Ser/Thr protein kinase
VLTNHVLSNQRSNEGLTNHIEDLFHEVADLPEEERTRYLAERAIDTKTEQELEKLLAFDSSGSTRLRKEIAQSAERALSTFDARGSLCGSYRLDNVLGHGGMGTVYSADRVDGEISRRVAVKLLRPGADDPRRRQLFLAERQILAALSHPNVAQLLDAGHRDDGQPYLVMEYVEGKTIDAFAAGLDVRQKIKLYLKVCEAVAYLHRSLVIHRDLKPQNILVTSDGEPKLLDFGIAKMLDLCTDSTETGMRMLTPDYASPEQVTGAPMSTATDIYSLGAVLYRLLTGKSPHRFKGDSMQAITTAISSGRITPPSRLAPGLDRDLEIILMTALRKEPRERYGTIEQFSEDLDNYLERRPIRARKSDAWYRTRKYLRRFWLPAAAAALTVAGLACAVIVVNHQRAIAQRRFIEVRQLANKLFDIDAIVRQTPGTTKARELIVGTSLEYLQKLAGEVDGDPELALELGHAYLRVARVQGVPITPNLGKAGEADRSLQVAESLMRSVLATQPANRTAMLRSAQVAHDRMILAGNRGASAEAMAFARKSAEFLRRYESTGTVDPREADAVAITYMNVSGRYLKAGDYDETIRLCRRAAEVARSGGSEPQAGAALMNVAEAYRQMGDLEQALQSIQESARILEPPAGTTNHGRQFSFINALSREGQILGEDGAISLAKPEKALVPLERGFAMGENLARQDANDAASRSMVATTGLVLADILRHTNPNRAVTVYDHVLRRLAEIPGNPRSRRQEVRALAGSTYPLRELGRNQEAKQRLDSAFAGLSRLKLYPSERIEPGSEADEALCALAAYEAGQGEIERAIEIYGELLRKVEASKPKPEIRLADAVDLSRLYAEIARLDRRAGRNPVATFLECRRLELWQQWNSQLPKNVFVSQQLRIAEEAAR